MSRGSRKRLHKAEKSSGKRKGILFYPAASVTPIMKNKHKNKRDLNIQDFTSSSSPSSPHASSPPPSPSLPSSPHASSPPPSPSLPSSSHASSPPPSPSLPSSSHASSPPPSPPSHVDPEPIVRGIGRKRRNLVSLVPDELTFSFEVLSGLYLKYSTVDHRRHEMIPLKTLPGYKNYNGIPQLPCKQENCKGKASKVCEYCSLATFSYMAICVHCVASHCQQPLNK